MWLEEILSFRMKFIWSKSTTPSRSKVLIISKLTMEICLVRSCVFYHIENQSKIIMISVYISLEKSDQAQF